MVVTPQPQPMSVAAYFELDDNAVDAKYEFYDGYVRLMAGGTNQHSIICVNIGTALSIALRGSGCRAFASDARVQLSPNSYVYPDVTVSCSPKDISEPSPIRSPRVVFEVLSPSTANFDRKEKTKWYRACASIEAFVLVDPGQLLVEVFQRDGVFWRHFPYDTADEVIDIAPLGIHIPLVEFYQDIELPPVPQPPFAQP